jgi:TIR domain/NACHT domain
MSLRGRYDVFLSYAHRDEATVEAAARHLESAGLAVFFAKWHLVPGEPWQEALEQCLSESGTCAVFIGASGLGKWENEELRTALDDRVQGQLKRVIPVLLSGAVEDQVPKFLRRFTYVDARDGWNAHTVGRLISGIHGTPVEQQPRSQSLARLALGIVHPLPPAPVFVGREREIAFLRDFIASPSARVASLVGLGGAGKTALVSRFIDEITQSTRPAVDDLFVWSFYLDQDASVFLKTLLAHVGPQEPRDATGVALLYRLMMPLSDGRRRLIVMDGLERMQETRSKDAIAFGQISDPLLRQFVSRLCSCREETRCIITTRFPVSDLYPWKGQAYTPVPIDSLASADAKALLARHGVQGDDRAIDQLIATFGSHALTLDHLGVYLREYRSGHASAAEEFPEPASARTSPRSVASRGFCSPMRPRFRTQSSIFSAA